MGLIILLIFIVITFISFFIMFFGLKFAKKNYYGLRLKCTKCKYCKKRIHYGIYSTRTLPQYISEYCYLLKKDLRYDSRCIIKDKDLAFYEEKHSQ